MWRYSALLGGGSGGGGAPVPMQPTLTFGLYGLTPGKVDLVAGGAADTKGAYISLGTLTQPIDFLRLQLTSSSSRPYLLDLEANGSAIVSDRPFMASSSGAVNLDFPLRIPAGALRARIASNAASQTPGCYAIAATSDVPQTATVMEPIGPVGTIVAQAGVSVGSLPTSSPAWTRINETGIANALKGIAPFLGHNGKTSTRIATIYTIEIGTGPNSGSVTALPYTFAVGGSTSGIAAENMKTLMQSFPAGTIFWMRITAAASNSDEANYQIHGIR